MRNGILSKGPLSSNALKLIAAVAMAIDHIGFVLLDDFTPFRIIGRLSYPIFAYLIAEGCQYTKNKLRHFMEIFILGLLCQAVYTVFVGDLFIGVLLSFSLSIPIIYAVQKAKQNRSFGFLLPLLIIAALFLCEGLPRIFRSVGFTIDYGFAGVMLPVLVSIPKKRELKLAAAFIGILGICFTYGGLQWHSLFSLIFLALYNGKRGNRKFKYAFYLFYPLHLAIIYIVALLL